MDHENRIKNLEKKLSDLYDEINNLKDELLEKGKKWLLSKEASEKLNCTQSFLRGQVTQKNCFVLNKHFKKRGSRYLFNVEAIKILWETTAVSDLKIKNKE